MHPSVPIPPNRPLTWFGVDFVPKGFGVCFSELRPGRKYTNVGADLAYVHWGSENRAPLCMISLICGPRKLRERNLGLWDLNVRKFL